MLMTAVISVDAWIVSRPAATSHTQQLSFRRPTTFLTMSSNDDASGDDEGADLAAEFFKMAQSKGIGLDETDLLEEDDDEDEDEEEDEEVPNIPQGAVNAFLGYDAGIGQDDALAGNVSLTNDQLYSEVKERVLDTAGGFVEYVKGARDEDDEDDEDDDEDNTPMTGPKAYQPPSNIPDADLTAGEVVLLVLEALRNNDTPTHNKGVEILFGFSSPTSQVMEEAANGLTPSEYAEFLKETEYKVLFLSDYEAAIEKADYSVNGEKAFMTARLFSSTSELLKPVNVNFILSSCQPFGSDQQGLWKPSKENDDDETTPSSSSSATCWMVDSILIRPESMRRRRRR